VHSFGVKTGKEKLHWSTELGTLVHSTTRYQHATTMCFFGVFRVGEITILSTAVYDAAIHLSWGDVAIDNPTSPKLLKTDQLGKGADVFIGKTNNLLYPVSAILTYMAARGSEVGAEKN